MEPLPNDQTFVCTTPSDLEIAMTRLFDAPRETVFEALMKPELVRQWFYGEKGNSLSVCEMDVHPGGEYHFQWQNPFGKILGSARGKFLEVDPPKRYSFTLRFDEVLFPGEAVNTGELLEEGGQTRINIVIRYESKQARDIVLNMPFERNNAMNFSRLERVLLHTTAPV